jgi:hypothetical protein
MRAQTSLSQLLLAVVALLALPKPALQARSGGPPVRRTGSLIFNELNCTACHRTNPVNSGSGSLTLTGVPSTYALGQTYDLSVSVQQSGQSRWGFQLAARVRASVTQAGTLQPGSDGFTQIQLDDTAVQFISHTSVGTRLGTANGPVVFNFTWTAPATSAGEIVFSLAGNAANGNGANTDDFIYTREVSSQPPDPPTVTANPSATAILVPFVVETSGFHTNLGLTNLTANAATATVQFIDQSGGAVASKEYTAPANGLFQVGNVLRDLMGSASTPNRQGYLLVESAQTISAWATPIDNVTLDPSVVQGMRGKGPRVIVPTSTSMGSFTTSLTVLNDANAANTVQIRLRDPGGTIRATRSITLAPYGFLQTENVHAFLGVTGMFGPIEVRSTNQAPLNLVAIARVSASVTTAAGLGTVGGFFSGEAVP